MAKKMSSLTDVVKNAKIDYNKKLDNVGKFNKGQVPQEFGPADAIPGSNPQVQNTIGGYSAPNDSPETHGKDYDEKVRTPKNPSLNAVSMPNNNKGKRVNYGVLKVRETSDDSAAAVLPVGGTPMPQNIK